MPAYQVMGNHDKFASNRYHCRPGTVKDVLDRLGRSSPYVAFDHGRWRFVLLDSVFPEKGGGWNPKLDEKQMAWLKSELKAAEGRPVCVALHVPVITSSTQLSDGPLAKPHTQSTMHDAKELRQLFEAHNVKLVLQGHVHIREHYGIKACITYGGACPGGCGAPRTSRRIRHRILMVTGYLNYFAYGWKAKKQAAYNARPCRASPG